MFKLGIHSISLSLLLCASFVIPVNLLAQEIPTPDYTTNTPQVNPNDLLLSEKIPGLEEQIDIKIVPENPKPEQETSIEVNMFGADINRSLIVWKVNGVEKQKGIGQKKFLFTNGQSGSVTKVDVAIFPKSGVPIQKSFSFSPIDVDILWQARTYTPPFYKGKALYSPESEVDIVSIPNAFSGGVKIDPSEMVYRWKFNYELENDASGYNKNVFYFKGPIILRENLIQSSVSAGKDPKIQGSNSVKLNHVSPQVLMYEDSPTLGVLFNKAVSGEFNLTKDEIKFSAFPLFFSTQNKNLKVGYTWAMDANPVDVPKYQNTIIFRKTSATKGTASIRLLIDNASHILQRSILSFVLTYEN